ncbi:hypothetical protein A2707_03165 [Candidatus Saccharibacteria bacterium RIFCSPHIGHO2_01_FULL_45_15]|nr:MAG: hypothetical protein A2707_03165 [Candidatus Saccharibacteria bacterium RIFCSPHIGHO2_01_FULL_45_15]OGL28462.1 MAG: hypothetical protein A3C39_02895 [Candidatus Saccharibacteria bacterium RIFCSPHIGHO2_02_FULL_46_12]OGL32499.1 MAG: hypothetical protein A3E76_00405 [Candidatus Saccharibacteria bacterium RIFCSPHIGHO2_12_FULL_44_22]
MNIVAIGGGNKNAAIRHAIDLTGEQKPNALLLPSACSTELSYAKKVPLLTDYFETLGVDVTRLHDFDEQPTSTKIAHELGRASMFYTIGGNSPHMLATMQKHGTDSAIRQAILDGKVHAGTSAGALLPFELAQSNIAKRPTEEEWDYEFLPMLGLLKCAAAVHANQHDKTPSGSRSDTQMEHMMTHLPASATRGIAIDNGAAVVISSQGNSVIASDSTAGAYIIERKKNKISAHTISSSNDLELF